MQDLTNIKVNFDNLMKSLHTTSDDIEFRKKSFDRFYEKGFPEIKNENWKYSPLVKDLKKFTDFNFKSNNNKNLPKELFESFDHYSIIFIDGTLITKNFSEKGIAIKQNSAFLKSIRKEGENPILK
jgi:Fe-S cluster assembly protein SufD